jgi:hypothetical protein
MGRPTETSEAVKSAVVQNGVSIAQFTRHSGDTPQGADPESRYWPADAANSGIYGFALTRAPE